MVIASFVGGQDMVSKIHLHLGLQTIFELRRGCRCPPNRAGGGLRLVTDSAEARDTFAGGRKGPSPAKVPWDLVFGYSQYLSSPQAPDKRDVWRLHSLPIATASGGSMVQPLGLCSLGT
jgi:hypothetical protein